ncbi:MAG: hypothetical protein OEV93_00335 [Candidatus Moranbacteria bacterium]|nr:hypothetical protein [Candidatus Moranbacteria bacterium]
MYEKILSVAGLSPKEAEIYEILLNIGQAEASEIFKQTTYKRGLLYKILEQLIEKGLIVKIEKPRKPAVFRVEHPNKITEMLDLQAQKVTYYKKSIEDLMPQLISNYNLAFHKPGIRFFEGKEGVRRVLDDTLTAKETIYTYVDMEAIVEHINDINKAYVKKREKLDIKKKGIVLDSPFTRKLLKNYHTSVTDTRFMDHTKYSFSSIMQIYDDRVAYISLSEDSFTSIIIQDKNIYQMHKQIFEFNWQNAKTYEELTPLSKAQ